jgi:phage repressor protein C with HTH and peptisase S24 domain
MKKSEERPIDRVLRWTDERGWDQSELARQLGVEPGHVTNWKGIRGLPKARYEQVAILFGRSLDEVAGRVPEESKNKSTRRVESRLSRVPVRGTAQLDQEGYWKAVEKPAQTGDGYIEMPSRDLNAYAIRVIGDAMYPRIKSGEYVVVEPGHASAPGDDVMVTLKDGRTMVREFLFERDGQLALQATNPGHARLTLAIDSVQSVHYVSAIARSAVFD